jgi:hypothetical protein
MTASGTQSVLLLGLPSWLLQFKPGDIAGPANLAQLLDLQWEKAAAAEQPAAVAGVVAATEVPPAAMVTAAAGVAQGRLSAAQWWSFPQGVSEAFKKVRRGFECEGPPPPPTT